MCRSLLYCFLTMINNGMRWHCGVGKITRSESYIVHFWPFVHRFLFDLFFALKFIIAIFALVFS